MIYTAQCPHCDEKLHWGRARSAERDLPDRCPYCFEPLSQADRALLIQIADMSIAEGSFNLPAEG